MVARQTLPRQWLIFDTQSADELWQAVRRVPRGSGILVLGRLLVPDQRRLRSMAAARGLMLAEERRGSAVRVHNVRELRAALLRRTPLILLSPIYPTGSHPDWAPLPRMRAGAWARLGRRRLFALGGMNQDRFRQVERLGFQGWAGISAFRT